MPLDIGDKYSTLFQGLSGFWQKFFKDAPDLEAYYQAAEIYLGQAYLDLLAAILNIGVVDTPIFNKEYWKLFAINENEVNFQQGESVAQDRYVYDMPGDIVITEDGHYLLDINSWPSFAVCREEAAKQIASYLVRSYHHRELRYDLQWRSA